MEKNQNKLRLFFAFALISIASTDTGKVFIHELTHTAFYHSFNITFYFMDNDNETLYLNQHWIKTVVVVVKLFN